MRILYVDVDTLRADHLRPYGYHRATAPNLEAMAADSVLFDRYYCSDAPCLPSRAALSSGQFGVTNGVVGHFGRAAQFRLEAGHGAPPGRPLFGQQLQRHGWYTAAVSIFAERHRAYWFCGNYREVIRATGELNDEQAHDINPVAIDWMRRHRHQDKWFLHVHYWEPHTNYLVPANWVERAAALGPTPAWPNEETIAAHAGIYGPRSALDLHYTAFGPQRSAVPHSMPDAIRNRADLELLTNGYDATICYWDYYFGQLLAELQDLGIADETAVIVSADHGESLGENGSYAEHGLANEPTLRVPLVVHWPGVTDVVAVDVRHRQELLYNIDLAPTLCELLNIPVPPGWQGRSFAPAVRGEPIEKRPYLVLGQGAHTYQRAVRTAHHLYLRTYHPGSFRAEWEQLFDMDNDTYLTRDLMAEEPERAAELRDHLSEWWHQYAGRPGSSPDPMLTTLQTGPTFYANPSHYMEHLRSTGRGDQADDLRSRLQVASGTPAVWWESPEVSSAMGGGK